jgi:hypothetical protein
MPAGSGGLALGERSPAPWAPPAAVAPARPRARRPRRRGPLGLPRRPSSDPPLLYPFAGLPGDPFPDSPRSRRRPPGPPTLARPHLALGGGSLNQTTATGRCDAPLLGTEGRRMRLPPFEARWRRRRRRLGASKPCKYPTRAAGTPRATHRPPALVTELLTPGRFKAGDGGEKEGLGSLAAEVRRRAARPLSPVQPVGPCGVSAARCGARGSGGCGAGGTGAEPAAPRRTRPAGLCSSGIQSRFGARSARTTPQTARQSQKKAAR